MRLSLIAAMANNRVIGIENRLPWQLSADLQHFKKITMGKPILMGRKTYESIGRPLPGRENIVLTRDKSFSAEGCTIYHSIDEALEATRTYEEVMVIGGDSFYRQLISKADSLYLTFIELDIEGDAFFPEYSLGEWEETERESFEASDETNFGYHFTVWERR
ncbi:MAG: type 3 dihydrofolate reductase [Gammaproteobacteria bacterium]|nr:MAG: type 3 dihydrofolate reductase [Gammaproteobacteria bacterium]RLA24589.1 MAG: type 3 dihydrofolate reductase [Gammaproteobacteria bacterium]